MQFLVYVFFVVVVVVVFFFMKWAIPFISLLFHCICIRSVYMLWFKFSFGAKFFKLV